MPSNSSQRADRFLRNVFFVAAGLLAVYAVMFGNYLHGNGEFFVHSRIIWSCMAGMIFFITAGKYFSLKAKFKLFMALLCLLLLEILLQATAWLGVLPAANTKLKAPFARVYWAGEGRGNGIRNRFGWYYGKFDLQAAHKIAYIGDSQVEAVEVSCTQNQAADLQKLLKMQSPDWAVLGLGTHGSCVAHSIDVLEYASKHFQPQEAIVVVSTGSDVTEASSKLNYVSPSIYIYYDLDAAGNLVLQPDSAPGRAAFDRDLEFSHQSFIHVLPVILNSHCMTLQLVDAVRDRIYLRRRVAELLKHGDEPNGFNPQPFAINPSPEAQRAMQLVLAELDQCRKVCASHSMKFKVVTVPAFPKIFYDTQRGTNWTTHIGDYDYFIPERAIAGWARTNDVPIVSMSEVFQQKKMDVEDIRSLYFSNGTGHLTPKGHAFVAQTVFDNFYNEQKK